MEKGAWPKKFTGPKRYVEARTGPERRLWREPDEVSEDSIETVYHQVSPRSEQLGILGTATRDEAHSGSRGYEP